MVDVVLDEERDIDSGTYTATFDFEAAGSPSVSLGFSGTIGALTQAYSITSSSGTVSGTIVRPVAGAGETGRTGENDTVTITDGSATLTLVSEQGQIVFPANLSVGETVTGTVGDDGIIEYTDNTVQALPAIVL